MKNEKPNLRSTNKRVDSFGRCHVPKLFVQTVGAKIEFILKAEGLLLCTATEDSKITVCNDLSTRICIPRNLLRVFGKPNLMEVEFVDGRPDRVFMRPMVTKCCHCGRDTNLHDVYQKEVFVCIPCLNKAFDLKLPMYENDSF